jgi:hypothetical protein
MFSLLSYFLLPHGGRKVKKNPIFGRWQADNSQAESNGLGRLLLFEQDEIVLGDPE